MPRSSHEILHHADELAERFEDYEPDPVDERPVEEHLLERAAHARARGERQIVDAGHRRPRQGRLKRIGELLGTSAQAAQQRYGAVVEAGWYRSGSSERRVPYPNGAVHARHA